MRAFSLSPRMWMRLLEARAVQRAHVHGHAAAPHPVVLAVRVEDVVGREVAPAHLEGEAEGAQRARQRHVHMAVQRARRPARRG